MAKFPALGTFSQITISTKNIAISLDFYQLIGFSVIAQDRTAEVAWAQISDGSLLILLNEDGTENIGLTYFEKGISTKVAPLKEIGVRFLEESNKVSIIQTPENLRINLVDYEVENTPPECVTLANYKPEEWNSIQEYPNERMGIFGEFSMPVEDLEIAIGFWTVLGFEANKFDGPYPWAILTDGMNIIGLHQTKEFSHKAITYFAKDMGDRIQNLRRLGLTSIEVFKGTGGNESNVVVTSPENQRFFLFSY